MKKKLCMALSVLMILMTLCSPLSVFAEKDTESSTSDNTSKTEQQSEDSSKESSTTEKSTKSTTEKKSSSESSEKSSKNDESSKTSSNSEQYKYQSTTEQSSNVENDTISIIFTGDIHSQIDATNQGMARAASIFKEISSNYKEDSFILDAGDFSRGSGFDAVYESVGAELCILSYLGYDAVTLGCNEFCYGDTALANMIKNAGKQIEDNQELPEVCLSNIDWDKSDSKDIKKAFKKAGINEDYAVIEKNEIKIAVFGLLTDNDAESLENSSLSFENQKDRAEEIVKQINKKEKDVEFIVCLANSGTENDDKTLAQEVSGIDLIISGHNDSKLKEPVEVSDTLIVSAGSLTKGVGSITFKKNEKTEKYEMDEYKVYKNSSKITKDAQTESYISELKNKADSKYFGKYGLSIDQKIAKNKVEFAKIKNFGLEQGEETLGNLVSDAYIYVVEKTEGKKADDVDVAIVPKNTIKQSLDKGSITVSEVFNMMSYGQGEDGSLGYALCSIYLTGKELKNIAELDATVSQGNDSVRLYTSGLSYKINNHRIKYNKAFDIKLGNGEDSEEIDNEKLYRVVTDYDSLSNIIKTIEEEASMLSITPKDEEGNIITDYKNCILKKNKSELKAWYAVAAYLDKMGTVSSKYKETEGRKIVSDSKNLREIFCQPNKIGWLLRLAVLVPVIIILLILVIVGLRRRKKRANMMFSVSERQKKAIFAPPKKQKNLFAGNNKRNRRRNRRNGRY